MRRKKVEITYEIEEMVKSVVEFLPNDMKDISVSINESEKLLTELHKMKHTDFIKCRKHLLEAEKKIKKMRENILKTYKIFTEPYD